MPRSTKPSRRRLGHRTAKEGPRAVRIRPKPLAKIVDTAGVLGDRDKAAIQREINKLAAFSDRILEVRITVTAPHRRLHREVVRYQVRVHVVVPLGELVVKRQEAPRLMTALQEAFKAARRLVQDYVDRHWAPPQPVAGAASGRVVRLFPHEGFGFIKGGKGDEVYFHRNSVLDGKFEMLDVGSRVRYTPEAGREGLQASTVALGKARPRSKATPPE